MKRTVRHTAVIMSFSMVAALLGWPVAHSFQLAGGPGGSEPHQTEIVDPLTHPPFLHWDLRELPSCSLPYTVSATGTSDVVGVTEHDEVELAADAWSAAPDALITLRRTPATTAISAWGQDSFNVLVWDGGRSDNLDLFPARDDQQVAGRNPGTTGLVDSHSPEAETETSSGRLNLQIVTFGPDGEPNTTAVADDIFVGPVLAHQLGVTAGIYAGPDGIADTQANNGRVAGATCIFSGIKTNTIFEADIVLNDRDFSWSTQGNQITNPAVVMDVRTAALHFIGHTLGLAHGALVDGQSTPAMAPLRAAASGFPVRHHLSADDAAGVAFLYSPDLGDGRDPGVGLPDSFPTRIRAGKGRSLNNVDLDVIGNGAMHLYDSAPGSGARTEMLGFGVDGECNPRQVDLDSFDDGVRFVNGRVFSPDADKIVSVTISHARWQRYGLDACAGGVNAGQRCTLDDQCPDSRCAPDPTTFLYLNGWCDWNDDGLWDDFGEKVVKEAPINPLEPKDGWVAGLRDVGTMGTITKEIVIDPQPSSSMAEEFFCRFRLDWGEDAGEVANLSGNLDQSSGIAQYGEVEDYLVSSNLTGARLFFPPTHGGCLDPVPGEYSSCYLALERLGTDDDSPAPIHAFNVAVEYDPSVISVTRVDVVHPVLSKTATTSIDNDAGRAYLFFSLDDPGTPATGCNNLEFDDPEDVLSIEYLLSEGAEIGSAPPFRIVANAQASITDEPMSACRPTPYDVIDYVLEVEPTELIVNSDDGTAPEVSISVSGQSTIPKEINISATDAGSGIVPGSLSVSASQPVTTVRPDSEGHLVDDVSAGENLASSFTFHPGDETFRLASPIEFAPGETSLEVAVADHDGNMTRQSMTLDLVEHTTDGCSATSSVDALCLGEDRFRVEVTWQDFKGRTGAGVPVGLTRDTGYFWFFNDSNVELVVKVLDGRPVNGFYWVFYGALTNVAYTMTVTDIVTGASKVYTNPLSNFASFGDTRALPGDSMPEIRVVDTVGPGFISRGAEPVFPSVEPMASGTSAVAFGSVTGCQASDTTLCLNQGRFELSVEWRDFKDRTGSGHAVPLTGDTGYFWFFDETNVELVVKVLDGRTNNGCFWLFFGALSNVEYTITLTDTETGNHTTYHNPSGTFASFGDTRALCE